MFVVWIDPEVSTRISGMSFVYKIIKANLDDLQDSATLMLENHDRKPQSFFIFHN